MKKTTATVLPKAIPLDSLTLSPMKSGNCCRRSLRNITITVFQNYPSLTTLYLVNREGSILTQIQPGGRMYVDHNIIPWFDCSDWFLRLLIPCSITIAYKHIHTHTNTRRTTNTTNQPSIPSFSMHLFHIPFQNYEPNFSCQFERRIGLNTINNNGNGDGNGDGPKVSSFSFLVVSHVTSNSSPNYCMQYTSAYSSPYTATLHY